MTTGIQSYFTSGDMMPTVTLESFFDRPFWYLLGLSLLLGYWSQQETAHLALFRVAGSLHWLGRL